MKKLNLNKESLQRLDEKKMSELRGGVNFLSLWGSNCYATNPLQHQCCRPTTAGDPYCPPNFTEAIPCIPQGPEHGYGDAHVLGDGTVQYLDDAGVVILNASFDPGDSPYIIVP